MPDVTTEQALNLAIQHHQAGRIAEAQAIHRQILAREPNNADALHLLGVIAYQTGRRQEAVKLIQRAIAINPTNAIYHNNLGIALRVMGQFDQAAKAYQESVRLKPDYADAYYNLGITLQSAGKLQEALAAYQSAIHYKPDFPDAYLNLGNTFQELNQNDQAVAVYRAAIGIKSDYFDAYYNLGNILKDVGMVDQAIAACRKAVEIKPDSATAHDNLLLTLLYHPESCSRQIFQELARWNLRHAEPLKKFVLPHTNNLEPERRLKIGYVSGDFQKHVVGWNLLPLLRQHNREQLEIFCYSSSKSFDNLTQSIKESADVWRNIAGVDDQKAAQMIRDDQIDILVDLSLHSGNNRLLVFARKPAPVQVTYLGYAGSTGLDTIDYRFSDPYLDPPETDLSVYSEQTMRLPEAYWCYQPGGSAPQVTPLPALSGGFITFGCLNNLAKVSSGAWDLWMQILGAVPNSRVIIYAHAGSHRDAVWERFGKNGIAPERLEFIGKQPWPEYMNTYNRIDIALDPFPYNGGITTCDSLYMGVPVVSLSGQTPVGRAGKSILSNVGLPELVAKTPQEYVKIAVKLAGDISRLAELRKTLRQRMENSPLMDAKRFTNNIEAAYREMWRKCCAVPH